MKSSVIVLCFGLALTARLSPATEIVVNGSFEGDTAWTYVPAAARVPEGRTGIYCVKGPVLSSTTIPPTTSHAAQAIKTVRGADVTSAWMWAKTDDPAHAVMVYVTLWNVDGSSISRGTKVQQDWTRVDFTSVFSNSPATYFNRIAVWSYHNVPGFTFWVDDICVEGTLPDSNQYQVNSAFDNSFIEPWSENAGDWFITDAASRSAPYCVATVKQVGVHSKLRYDFASELPGATTVRWAGMSTVDSLFFAYSCVYAGGVVNTVVNKLKCVPGDWYEFAAGPFNQLTSFTIYGPGGKSGSTGYVDDVVITGRQQPNPFRLIGPANKAVGQPQNGLVLTWDAAVGATGGYDVCYGTTNEDPPGGSGGSSVHVAGTSHTLNGLTPGQTYYWNVKAVGTNWSWSRNGNRRFEVGSRDHDVGVTEIVSPAGAVDSGAPLPVRAKVSNYGVNSEGPFGVRFRLSDGTARSSTVTSLTPGATTDVDFGTWVPHRGTFAESCWTELAVDQYRHNDTCTGSATVTVHDVGVTEIVSPVGAVDSGAAVPVQARVKNLGNVDEPGPFAVHLRLSDGTDLVAGVTDLTTNEPPRLVDFGTWVPHRGTFAESCWTELAADQYRHNDTCAGSVTVAVHDVGVADIVVPAGTIGENTDVYPLLRVANHGTQAEAFEVNVTITTVPGGIVVFDSTETATGVLPGEHGYAFSDWYWRATPPGSYAVAAMTVLAGDQNPGNDASGPNGFAVTAGPVHDVGVTEIVSPVGAVDSGAAVPVQARVKNLGNVDEPGPFAVHFRLSDGTDLVAGVTDLTTNEPPRLVDFGTWVPHRGTFAESCFTLLAGDVNLSNDTCAASVAVGVRDAGVTGILAPFDSVGHNGAVYPKVRVTNFGTGAEDVAVRVVITSAADEGVVFDSTETVTGLAPGEHDFEFGRWYWLATPVGAYEVEARTVLAGDLQPQNDAWGPAGFRVVGGPSWPDGWVEVEKLPVLPSGRAVKDGGWLAQGADGLLYGAKGNKTGDFYRHDPLAGSQGVWTPLESLPRGSEGKAPSKGSVGVGDDQGGLYATKGNNTLGFWRYDIGQDTWVRLPDVPPGPDGKKVKGGTDLAYVVADDTGWVYLLKGYRNEFYRYNTRAGRWDTMPMVPYGVRPKYDKGSFLVAGAGGLYAHQAKYITGANHHMFKFDVASLTWTDTLRGMPLYGLHNGVQKRKKSKDGGSGAWHGGELYALKGGNTGQLFRYLPGRDSWYELDTMPQWGSTAKRKRVKNGGDMVYYDYGAFFAFKGNKTVEFWRYVQPTAYSSQPTALRSGVMAKPSPISELRFAIAPNPIAGGYATIRYSLPKAGPVTVTAFDVAGRTVLRQSGIGNLVSGITLDLRKVPAGVYLVRLDADCYTQSQKLVVQR